MRIGIVTYGLGQHITGIGRYTIELIKALQATRTVELHLLICGNDKYFNDLDICTHRITISSRLPELLTAAQFTIPYYSRRLQLDIVHDPTGVNPLFLNTFSKNILTIHDTFAHSIPGYSTTLDTLIYKYWLPQTASNASKIITPSKTSKQDIVRYLNVPNSHISIVHEGVNLALKHVTINDVLSTREKLNLPEHYILFVGSLEKRKNLERVLSAYVELKTSGQINHTLVLVGPKMGKFQSVMQSLSNLPIENDVIITGYVDQEDLPKIYAGADLFVFPSLYEGFGLPVIEAMACGTPVITSNVSSLPEVAGDAAVLVDPSNTDAIASAIFRVLQDEELQAKMVNAGLSQASKFTWANTARKTIEVYEDVLS